MLRGRRADVQGLRGVAVLLVVAFHLDVGFHGGYVGVDVFFVISGFVIGGLLHREVRASGTIDLVRFYARRIRRLWPALALMTLVVLAVGAVSLNPYDHQPFAIRTAAAAHLLVANMYLYRHVGYFDDSAVLNPFLHTWSLSIEEQICIVVPVLVAVAARRKLVGPAIAATTVISFALWWAMASGAGESFAAVPARFAFFSMPTRVWQFGLGALVAVHWDRVAELPRRVHRFAGPFALVAGVVAVTTASAGAAGPTSTDVGGPIAATAAAAAAIVAGATPTTTSRALSVGALTRVGDISYAWYLWHWPALVFVSVLAPDSLGWRVVAVLVAAVIAMASTWWWEHPIRAGRSPFRSDRDAIEARSPATIRLAAACLLVPLLGVGGAWVGAERGWGVDVPIGWWDLPAGRQVGCNLFNHDVANEWPGDPCRVEVDDQVGAVLVLGDQHADGVASGVAVAAGRHRLGTAVWSRTDCPLSGRSPVGYPRCAEWQAAAVRLVEEERPVAVVVANQSSRYVDVDGPIPIALEDGSMPVRRADAVASWRAGSGELVAELRGLGVPVVVVGPAPDHGRAFPRARVSVLRPSVDAPTITADAAQHQRRGAFDADRDVARHHDRVAVVDPLGSLCPGGTCPTRVDGDWWYYDARFLTATGGRRLASVIERALLDVGAVRDG